jgi:DNA-binding CsgD family transcriptional regulator
VLREHLISNGLSNREAEVAGEVAKGLSNKQAAANLFVTEKTIKFHLTNIYKKLDIKSRSQLIIWCAPKMDFIEDPEESTDEIPAGVPKLPR